MTTSTSLIIDLPVDAYTRALGHSPPPELTETIILNRSIAFLRSHQFDAALSDIESLPNTTAKPAEKALFREADALYHLRRYRECCETLKVLRLEYPSNSAAKDLMTRAIARLAEETSGNEAPPPHLDHATFLGPVVVKPSETGGRGLFTTRAVKAGELLFCEKAFTHAFVDEANPGNSSEIAILVYHDQRMTMGAQPDLISATIQKLHRNPSLLPIVTDLHCGSYQPVETSQGNVDGKPIIDSFHIQTIISLNSFGCPSISSLASHKTHSSPGGQSSLTSTNPAQDIYHSVGLWPTASYTNHSCLGTARRAFIGDMMIARATRDLVPDTEVVWPYWPPQGTDYAGRQKKLAHWGFVCTCALCEDDKAVSAAVLGKRRNLVAQAGREVVKIATATGRQRPKGSKQGGKQDGGFVTKLLYRVRGL